MRIIECYIENFGKISKQKYSFQNGLNCIKDDNGSGKTTLAAFIKVMLYGMSDTKKTSLEENDRKHYLPWQGGVCGGSLTFSVGSKIYRVERSFAPKASDDSFTLYDTATGRICNDFPGGLGEGLFGIDADGFERTVFLSERALTPQSENKSISAKLSDLVGCDGDIGGMDDAMKILEERRKFYYKKGGSGELSDIKSRIDELSRKIDSLGEVEIALDATHKKMVDLSTRMQVARSDAKSIFKEREAATVRAAEANFEKKYAGLKAELEDCIARRTAVGEIFGLNIPSFTDIDVASYKSTEAKSLTESIEDDAQMREFATLSAKFDGKVEKAQIEEVRKALFDLNKQDVDESNPEFKRAKRIFVNRIPTEDEINSVKTIAEEKKAKSSVGCILSYAIFAILAMVGVFVLPLLIIGGAIGIIATIIIDAVIKSKAKRERQRKINEFFNSVSGINVNDDAEIFARLEDMKKLLPIINGSAISGEKERLYSILAEIVRLFPEHYSDDKVKSAEIIVKEYDRYAEMTLAERYIRGDRVAKIERAAKMKREADEFVARFKTKTNDPFGELRSALTEYNRLTAEIVARRDEMAKLQSLNSMGESSHQKAMSDIDAIDRKRRDNETLTAELSREYAITERMYNSYIEELDGRDELYMRRAELEDALAKHKDNYETVLLTKKYITQAKDNMTSRYLGKTKEGFVKYAEMIGGISGESFEMDTDFGITKQEGATTRTTEAYSRGTRDLFNLAARLALVDSLYEKEKPFIILDDPFTAFDDHKTSAALKALKEFSKERQVIYFTCSKSRSV